MTGSNWSGSILPLLAPEIRRRRASIFCSRSSFSCCELRLLRDAVQKTNTIIKRTFHEGVGKLARLMAQLRGSRKDYSPRKARRPRLREPRFRSNWLRPFTVEPLDSNHPSKNSRLPNIIPRVLCATRRINTSPLTRRSVALGSSSRIFQKAPAGLPCRHHVFALCPALLESPGKRPRPAFPPASERNHRPMVLLRQRWLWATPFAR
jgi:hypothetical protein